jgi:hypothetical protein
MLPSLSLHMHEVGPLVVLGTPSVHIRVAGKGEVIGGEKLRCDSVCFAARPSWSESPNGIYAESFKVSEHLSRPITDSQAEFESIMASGIQRDHAHRTIALIGVPHGVALPQAPT